MKLFVFVFGFLSLSVDLGTGLSIMERLNQLEDLKLIVKEQENEISDLKEKAAEMSKAKKSQDETNEWLKSQIRKSDFSSKFHH